MGTIHYWMLSWFLNECEHRLYKTFGVLLGHVVPTVRHLSNAKRALLMNLPHHTLCGASREPALRAAEIQGSDLALSMLSYPSLVLLTIVEKGAIDVECAAKSTRLAVHLDVVIQVFLCDTRSSVGQLGEKMAEVYLLPPCNECFRQVGDRVKDEVELLDGVFCPVFMVRCRSGKRTFSPVDRSSLAGVAGGKGVGYHAAYVVTNNVYRLRDGKMGKQVSYIICHD